MKKIQMHASLRVLLVDIEESGITESMGSYCTVDTDKAPRKANMEFSSIVNNTLCEILKSHSALLADECTRSVPSKF